MRATTFAPTLEEQIPRGVDYSPGSISEASAVRVEELKNYAGRTPHTRKIEAERNVDLLKKSLMMSATKSFPDYYDSPASSASIADKLEAPSQRDENLHPNAEKRGSTSSRRNGFKSPQKFGSAAGKSFTFLPSDLTPQSTGWTPVAATSMKSSPALPLTGPSFTPAASLPPRAGVSPPTSATVSSINASPSNSIVESSPTAVESMGGSPCSPVANNSIPSTPYAAKVAESPFDQSCVATVVESIARTSFSSSPQQPFLISPAVASAAASVSPTQDIQAIQESIQGSPGQLWALLTDGATTTQSTPNESHFSPVQANTSNGELWAMLTSDGASVDGTPTPIPTQPSVRFEMEAISTPVSHMNKSAAYQKPQTPYLAAASSSAQSSRRSSPGDALSVMSAMSPLTVVPDPTPVSSPAPAYVHTVVHMSAGLKAPAPSPATASPVMGIAEYSQQSAQSLRSKATTSQADLTPVTMAAPVSTMSTSKAAVMYSPIGSFQYGTSPSSRDAPDEADTTIVDEADNASVASMSQEKPERIQGTPVAHQPESVRGTPVNPPAAAASVATKDTPIATPPTPVSVIASATPQQPAPTQNVCDISVSSISSTSSPVVLGRQGGVAMGRGPSLYPSKFATVAQKLHKKSPVKQTSQLNASTSSARDLSCVRVPVHGTEDSARKPAVPRQAAASRVDRKQLAFVTRSRSNSNSTTSGIVSIPKSVSNVSGVSRNTKRVKNDVKDSSVNTSYSSHSNVSVCGSESGSILTEPQHAAEQSIAMCNVSVQCDSFLVSGNTTAVAAGIATLNKGRSAALENRSSYDCFEEGLDSALSLNGSHVPHGQCGAVLDYSMDSPCEQTPPKSRHSPIFMSYRKLAHDSDSDDEMMQIGLDDLLAGSPAEAKPIPPSPMASPIARRHSFADSTAASIMDTYSGSKAQSQGKPLQSWEHSFIAPAKAATTPSTASSRRSSGTSSSQSTRSHSAPRTSSSRKGLLGSAKRVTLSGEVHEHAHVYGYAEANSEVSAQEADSSTVTDAAVRNHEVTALSENESQMFNLSMSTVASCAETTMTLDHKHQLSESIEVSGAQFTDCGPRLAVMPLKRDRAAADDIKEVSFTTSPGETTTVMLSISNHRSKTLKLYSHAVSLRVEEYAPESVRGQHGLLQGHGGISEADEDDALTVETAAPASSFQVSPSELRVAPGQEGTLYVTFTPQADLVGVYSGALKIRTKSKSFVMLLRGKAIPGYVAQEVSQDSQQVGIADQSKHELDTSLFKRIQQLNCKSASKASPCPERLTQPDAQVVSTIVSVASPAPAPAVVVPERVFATLSIQPDSLLLQKSAHCQRFETSIDLQLRNADYTEVTLQASRPYIKLSRTRVIMSSSNQESIKVMLDERSEELLQLCNAILNQEASAVTTAIAGFVSVHTATEGEYTVDVSITRSACFLIRQQHQQMVQRVEVPVAKKQVSPKSAGRNSCPLPMHPSTHSSTKRLLSEASSVETPRAVSGATHRAPSASRASTASSRPSPPSATHQTPPKPSSAPKYSAIGHASSASSVASDTSVTALAETLLMLRSEYDTPTRKDSGVKKSPVRSQSAGPAMARSSAVSAASASSDIRNFVKAHHDIPASPKFSYQSTTTVETEMVTSAESSVHVNHVSHSLFTTQAHTHNTSATATAHPHAHSDLSVQQSTASFMEKKVGVYFRKECINFGAVAIGSLTRANIELCNATDDQVTVYLGDPLQPYVLLHNEISLRPRSYVRVPLRFLPVHAAEYHNELIAQTSDGSYHTRIQLSGSAYA